ncbi:MAG: RcpC/CpaB family pilus assembly protein [Actinomycetota bacterium]
MNSRRTIILIVAVAVGLLASFGLVNYVRNVEGAVYDNAEPEIVWAVRRPIAKGTTAEQAISQGLIYETEIPAEFKPATSIEDPSLELAGLVAVTDLPVNSPLVVGNFVAPDVVNTGITDRLEEDNLVTVTFNVDQVKGAAYLIEPGDHVNVLSVRPIDDPDTFEALAAEGLSEPADDADGAAATSEEGGTIATYGYVARYLYQRAEVLAIDRSLAPDLGETEEEAEGTAGRNGGLITLAVPPEAAQVILSIGVENLYLSLLPRTYEPVELPPLDYGNTVLPGEDPERLTPYGPDGDVEEAR